MDWTIIVSTFTGAFVAAAVGYLFEVKRENSRMAKARRLLRVAISDDLQHSVSLYDKIAEEWEKTHTVWFSTLNELRESRFTYQNNKDWIHVFENQGLRRSIFRYYLQSAERINILEYQQRRKYEIQSRLNETLRDIKFKDPTIKHEHALQLAFNFMEGESREFDNLMRLIPESIQQLSLFQNDAQHLIEQLKAIK